MLLNPEWIDARCFKTFDVVEAAEPYGANALFINGRLIVSSAFPQTRRRLVERGYEVEAIDASELAKAEGALTCCSVIVAPR